MQWHLVRLLFWFLFFAADNNKCYFELWVLKKFLAVSFSKMAKSFPSIKVGNWVTQPNICHLALPDVRIPVSFRNPMIILSSYLLCLCMVKGSKLNFTTRAGIIICLKTIELSSKCHARSLAVWLTDARTGSVISCLHHILFYAVLWNVREHCTLGYNLADFLLSSSFYILSLETGPSVWI